MIWNLGLCSKIGWIQNLLNIYLRSLLCLFVTGIKWRGEGGEDEKSWKIINRLGYSQISVLIIKYTKEQKIEGEKYKITAPTKLAPCYQNKFQQGNFLEISKNALKI